MERWPIRCPSDRAPDGPGHRAAAGGRGRAAERGPRPHPGRGGDQRRRRAALRLLGHGRVRGPGRRVRASWRSPASRARGTPSTAWSSPAPRCASRPARWCPRAPARWCRWSWPRRPAAWCACPRARTGTNIRGRRRGHRGGHDPAGARDRARAGRAGRTGQHRPLLRALRRAAAGGAAGHRRRADAARHAAAARRHLQLERARAGRAGAGRGRPGGAGRGRARHRRGHPRGAGARAGGGGRGVRVGRRVRGPARPRQGRVRRARRGAALLARGAQAGKAHVVRHHRPGLAFGLPATRCRPW